MTMLDSNSDVVFCFFFFCCFVFFVFVVKMLAKLKLVVMFQENLLGLIIFFAKNICNIVALCSGV